MIKVRYVVQASEGWTSEITTSHITKDEFVLLTVEKHNNRGNPYTRRSLSNKHTNGVGYGRDGLSSMQESVGKGFVLEFIYDN